MCLVLAVAALTASVENLPRNQSEQSSPSSEEITQRTPTMAKMAETIRTLQEKLATVETKQYEFEQEGLRLAMTMS